MPVVVLDAVHWTQLEQVQLQTNHAVRYESDMELFGVPEWWEPAAGAGDCEDIALTKRRRLLDMGWPAESLRIAVLADGHGGLHAVLTVDVQSQRGKPGTYVLDSHFAHVEPWRTLNQYGYWWLARSRPGSSDWARLDGGSTSGDALMASLIATPVGEAPRWDDASAKVVRVKVQVNPVEDASASLDRRSR